MIRYESGSLAVLCRCVASASVALLYLLVAAPAGAQENAATFQFAPPDGTRYAETIDTTQVLDFGHGRISTTQIETIARYAVCKLPDGYSITSTLISDGVTCPVERAEQFALGALEGMSVTCRFDGAGDLVEVTGVAEVAEQLRKALTPEAAAALGNAVSEKALRASARAECESAISNLRGRSTAPGSVWLAAERYGLPTGEMAAFHVAYRVTGRQTVGGKQCVRVEFRYASDPVELRGFLGSEHESVLSGKRPFSGGARVSGRGHRIVDPATLLLYGQKVERVIEATIAIPSQGDMDVTIRQDKKYWYSYLSGG